MLVRFEKFEEQISAQIEGVSPPNTMLANSIFTTHQ